MSNDKLIINLALSAGLMAAGSLTGGAVLGILGTVGENWISNVTENAFHKYCDNWFTEDGALNHDLNKALTRAFQGAVKQMEEDWSRTEKYENIEVDWSKTEKYENIEEIIEVIHKEGKKRRGKIEKIIDEEDEEKYIIIWPRAEVDKTFQALKHLREDAPDLFVPERLGSFIENAPETLRDMVQSQESSEFPVAIKEMLEMIFDVYFQGTETIPAFRQLVEEKFMTSWLLRFREELKDNVKARTAYENLWQKSVSIALDAIQDQLKNNEKGIEKVLVTVQDMQKQLQQSIDPNDNSLETAKQVIRKIIVDAFKMTLDDKLDSIKNDTVYIRRRLDELSAMMLEVIEGKLDPAKLKYYRERSLAIAGKLPTNIPTDSIPDYAKTLPAFSRMPHSINPLFVGRVDMLKKIAVAFKQKPFAHQSSSANQESSQKPSSIALAITGMGGMGKTQLAVDFVHRYGQYFAGGVFWISFADPNNIPNEVAECGTMGSMDIPNFDTFDLSKQVKLVKQEWQSDIPRLLIFDNCEDEKLLQQWMPATGGCRILVTSRRFQWDSALNIQTHQLAELSSTESIALLRHFCPDVDEADPTLKELADELGNHPLALHLAGKFLETYQDDFTIQEYLDELRDEALLNHESLQGVDLVISPTNHELHVAKTFAISYETLQATDKKDALALALLVRMSWFALGEFVPRDLLLQSYVVTEEKAPSKTRFTSSLNRLANLGLLEINKDRSPPFLRLHRLLGFFVHNVLPDTQAQRNVQQTILQYVTTASDDGDAAKIIPIHAHVLHVLSGKVNDETTDILERIACHIAIADSAALRRDVATATIHYEQADTLLAEIADGDDEELKEKLSYHRARLGYGMGTLLEYTDPDNALVWLDKGLAAVEGSGSRNEARISFRKGAVYNGQELFADAESLLSKARALFGENDASVWKIRTLSNLGVAECSQGHLAEGNRWYQQALALCEKTNNRYEQIPIYNNQAYDLDLAGDWPKSAESYQKALDLAEELHDTEFLVRTPLNMGILYTNMGDDDKAREYLERSIHHARVYAIDEVLVLALMAKADLFIRQEKWDEATSCIEEAETAGKANPDLITPRQQTEIDRGWALIYLAQGKKELALEYAQKCVESDSEGADADMEMGMNYRVLGQVTLAFAKPDDAIDHFKSSLSYVKDDVPYEAARTHLEWGRAELERGNAAVAEIHLEQARNQFANLGAERDLALVIALEGGEKTAKDT